MRAEVTECAPYARMEQEIILKARGKNSFIRDEVSNSLTGRGVRLEVAVVEVHGRSKGVPWVHHLRKGKSDDN